MDANATAFKGEGRVNLLLHWIGVGLLKLLGWKVEGVLPETPRYVVIVAPHTSNLDYPIALFISWHYRMKGAWIGKHTIFSWPLFGWFFRKTGGMPINRGASQNFVERAVTEFKKRDRLVFALAPEGTRAPLPYWRSGFYHIACQARAPIVLGYLDYQRKAGGLGPTFIPTGNVEEDLEFIRNFYHSVTPKHPDRRSDIRFRE